MDSAWYDAQAFAYLATYGAILLLFYIALPLSVLSLGGAALCHGFGRRRASARFFHWFRLIMLFTCAVLVWFVGAFASLLVSDIAPAASVLVCVIGAGICSALCVLGWRRLAPVSKARYRRRVVVYE
jgi:hypothetical protein